MRRSKMSCTAANTPFAILLLAVLLGCDASPEAIDHSPDPQSPARTEEDQPADRIAQVEEIGRSGDRSQMPVVIESLSDESLEVRRAAARAAKRLVGGAIPFHADRPPEHRARMIDAYDRLTRRAEETNTEYLIDLVPVLLDDVENTEAQQREQAIRDVVLLTGVTFGLRSDDPPEIRQAYLDRYRKMWAKWNEPGNTALQHKRGKP